MQKDTSKVAKPAKAVVKAKPKAKPTKATNKALRQETRVKLKEKVVETQMPKMAKGSKMVKCKDGIKGMPKMKYGKKEC